MKKRIKKLLSSLLALNLLMTPVFILSVNANELGKVRVIVRNDTYSIENGALWDGLLVDEWINLSADSNALSVFIEAINKNNYTQSGAEQGNINEINGIAYGDNGFMSGWMGTINDWFTNQGLGSYSVSNGGLEAGDEICILYTADWGEDLGSSWYDNSTTLDDLSIVGGALKTDFKASDNEYILEIDVPMTEIMIKPTATNKNFQVRTYKNRYTPEISGAEYKRSSKIKVKNGDIIYIGVGDPLWPTMGFSEKATIYKLSVENKNQDIYTKTDEISNYFSNLTIPTVSSIGGEWLITGLARNNTISNEFSEGYYEKAVKYVTDKSSAKLDRSKSSENSRMIIALTSIGKDVTNVGGYNIIEPLSDFNFVKKQGLSGPVWALIALDSLNYEIPYNDDITALTTREKLISYILNKELENGGWDNRDTLIDPDMTAMVIQALSPYYSENNDVKNAIDRAVNLLSSIQNSDGSFSSQGSITTESCAQIIIALTSLGINPDCDIRFIKNGNSAIDALMSFGVENGFSHYGNDYEQMATEQAFLALVSLKRFFENKNTLYDMSDMNFDKLIPGDADCNGYVNILDATEIQKYIVQLVDFSESQLHNADFDNDGNITILDATEIQRYIVMK